MPAATGYMSEGIRVLLCDDHSLFRESLSRLLEGEPDFRIVGSCGSISEAREVLDREHADVVLLDYDLGEEQGTAFFGNGFDGRVLMVTAGMGDGETLRA